MKTFRLSRGCYDKFHRCPGWAGGGMKYPKGESRCANGRIQTWNAEGMRPLWKWRFFRCDTCNVVVLPYITQQMDPTLWWSHAKIARRRWSER